MKDQKHDLQRRIQGGVCSLASLAGCTSIFALAPLTTAIFAASAGLVSCAFCLFPNAAPPLFWLRKGAVLTSLIAVVWYQQARQVSGLSDNGFFCLLSSFGPVPAELWVSLAFAVIAGAQAALAVLTLVSALPLKRKD